MNGKKSRDQILLERHSRLAEELRAERARTAELEGILKDIEGARRRTTEEVTTAKTKVQIASLPPAQQILTAPAASACPKCAALNRVESRFCLSCGEAMVLVGPGPTVARSLGVSPACGSQTEQYLGGYIGVCLGRYPTRCYDVGLPLETMEKLPSSPMTLGLYATTERLIGAGTNTNVLLLVPAFGLGLLTIWGNAQAGYSLSLEEGYETWNNFSNLGLGVGEILFVDIVIVAIACILVYFAFKSAWPVNHQSWVNKRVVFEIRRDQILEIQVKKPPSDFGKMNLVRSVPVSRRHPGYIRIMRNSGKDIVLSIADRRTTDRMIDLLQRFCP